MSEFSGWAGDLRVEVGGHGVVSHTGSVAVRALADRSGLTGRLSAATTRRGFTPVHDRGRVLADTAVMIADGGRVLSDLATLRDQGELFGPVASDPTLWRTLNAVDALTRDKIAAARAKTRVHVWNLIAERHGGIPAAKVADADLGKTIVVRLDASIVAIQVLVDLPGQAAGTGGVRVVGIQGPSPLKRRCRAWNRVMPQWAAVVR